MGTLPQPHAAVLLMTLAHARKAPDRVASLSTILDVNAKCHGETTSIVGFPAVSARSCSLPQSFPSKPGRSWEPTPTGRNRPQRRKGGEAHPSGIWRGVNLRRQGPPPTPVTPYPLRRDAAPPRSDLHPRSHIASRHETRTTAGPPLACSGTRARNRRLFLVPTNTGP